MFGTIRRHHSRDVVLRHSWTSIREAPTKKFCHVAILHLVKWSCGSQLQSRCFNCLYPAGEKNPPPYVGVHRSADLCSYFDSAIPQCLFKIKPGADSKHKHLFNFSASYQYQGLDRCRGLYPQRPTSGTIPYTLPTSHPPPSGTRQHLPGGTPQFRRAPTFCNPASTSR